MEINFVVSRMTELSLTYVLFAELSGAKLRITQLYVRKHTVRCSLQTITGSESSPELSAFNFF